MEYPLFFVALYIGLICLEPCCGLPIDLSSVGTATGEAAGSVWVLSSTFMGVGFLVVAIGFVFSCVCCRNGKGFEQNEVKVIKEFSNSNGNLSTPPAEGFVNPASQSELTIFPPLSAGSVQSSERASVIRFEPLPDIRPPGSNLRPAAFSSGDRQISSQDWFYDPSTNFPRSQLKYVEEYGRGWFGRVVAGEATNILPSEPVTKVMVKMLHEDATPTDQMYFLHEAKMYRDLRHPNMLRLLGRCLETEPFLVLLEACPNGDLKTFLTQNLASAHALTEQGVILRMCQNITSGLAFMHEHRFIHTDLAARNCLVAPDLSVKIGDYGNSIDVFRSDYYCAGSVALPVRWCAPETLRCTDVTIETKEVTPQANVWTLAVVIWEVSEFCKMPYFELNDDQVIVRVLGEKNYFLPKPKMACLHKDEIYHLLKLCWNPPLQRPTAAQIQLILENLIASGRGLFVDPKRSSVDFEERWHNLKPNTIPKTDNAVMDVGSPLFRGAKVADSHMDSPLGVFMSSKAAGSESPRFCLKAEEGVKKSDSVQNLSGSIERLNDIAKELGKREEPPSEETELESWLQGVEVRNEEDERFVRNISEAIRDLDAALAMEKTSSSESSHQNSPGKETKQQVDFRLGADTTAFMVTTPKTFELSSLQNTEEPQSLNLRQGDLESLTYSDSLIFPVLKHKNLFETAESSKEGDSIGPAQSRTSSDTEEEIWKKRIERGEFSEKVKEKSKSIADLMVLTHIDTSDDSDGDLDRALERNINRNSFHRRSGSNPRSSLNLNSFGSETNLSHAVLEDEFRESLKKLSNEHKEHGRFDSLGLILPVLSQRENVLEFLRSSEPDPSEPSPLAQPEHKHPEKDFLGIGASENNDNTREGDEDKVQVQENTDKRLVVEKPSSSHRDELLTIPEISISEDTSEVGQLEDEPEQVVIPPPAVRPIRFVLKETKSLPTFNITPADTVPDHTEEPASLPLECTRKKLRFVLKEEADHDLVEKDEIEKDRDVNEGTEKVNNKERLEGGKEKKVTETDGKSVNEEEEEQQQQTVEGKRVKDMDRREENESVDKEMDIKEAIERDESRSSVVLGACEDFTLGYYQGVTTTFRADEPMLTHNTPADATIKEAINNLLNSETPNDSLDWDRHLDKTFRQNLNNSNFDDVSFPSLSLEPSLLDHSISPTRDILGDSFNNTPMTPDKTLLPVLETKVTDLNLSEEEADNSKVRTPDDERSSDSGFRDKGSLSESVEDGCEGKYNLEDIEAELERAYVKGAFNQKEKSTETKFEFEENKFYEDENKKEDDLSDIDGEIEFWQHKDTDKKESNSYYYPEVSELSPTSSRGWYLHPPSSGEDPSYDIDEEFMSALRSELQEKLPVQARSYEVVENEEVNDSRNTINIQYHAELPTPLSPIQEEADDKCCSPVVNQGDCSPHRPRKAATSIMESIKTIDTETFMQYLDFMVENEGRDFDDEEADILEEIVAGNDDATASPLLIIASEHSKADDTFEADIRSALGVELASDSTSPHSDNGQPQSIVLFEDLETDAQCTVEETKATDDILVVNTETNEATLLESPKPKSYMAFVEEADREEVVEVWMDRSEASDAFTPDSMSPERHLSSSNDGASTDITISSPDVLSDYFLTPNSDKSPYESPSKPTRVEAILDNDEANEIVSELKSTGILPLRESRDSSCALSEDSLEQPRTTHDAFLSSERKHTSELLRESSRILSTLVRGDSLGTNVSELSETHELSTSFMESPVADSGHELVTTFGEELEEQVNATPSEESEERKDDDSSRGETEKEQTRGEDCYTPDWESDSSGGEEEASSSSCEFIWKDGDKVSSVKAVAVTQQDLETQLYEKPQDVNSDAEKVNETKEEEKEKAVREEDEDDDGDESSTESSASITEFVPSSWNSMATPTRSALRAPHKTTERGKRNVWFKKQKYHCVYEYPREPSDHEDSTESPYKHFTYGVAPGSTLDYTSCVDWDVTDDGEGDGDGDLSLTDTDSDNSNMQSKQLQQQSKTEYNFYNLSTFDYDFGNSGLLTEDDEFFVSSSARPFQGGSSSQFFPGGQFLNYEEKKDKEESTASEDLWSTEEANPRDFVTPDSGVDEDLTSSTPNDKNHSPDENILDVLETLKFNFSPKILNDTNTYEKNDKNATYSEAFGESPSSNASSCDSPSSPLSPSGLGELRHARDKLKLDLPRNHNKELGIVLNNKKINKTH